MWTPSYLTGKLTVTRDTDELVLPATWAKCSMLGMFGKKVFRNTEGEIVPGVSGRDAPHRYIDATELEFGLTLSGVARYDDADVSTTPPVEVMQANLEWIDSFCVEGDALPAVWEQPNGDEVTAGAQLTLVGENIQTTWGKAMLVVAVHDGVWVPV